MKRILVIFTFIISLFLLAGCDNKKADSIEISKITPGRKDAYVELKLNNKNETIEDKTIEGVVYYENNKVSTVKVTIDDEDEANIEYIINITGLEVDKTYTLEVTALVNKVRKILAKETFKTVSMGGTKEDPKLIQTIQDFLDMEKDDTAYYRLENDLDFTDHEYKPIFATASKNFKGELDGNGKTIKNVTIIDRTTYSGIIGRNSGTIKNLNIENIKVDFTKSTAYSQYTSLLVGRNIGEIENVKVSGEIVLNFNTSIEINIGGIAAVMEGNGSIKNSEADFTLEIEVSSRAILNIGGLVGKFREGFVENSKAVVNYNIENAEDSNIGGAFGLVEYPNKIKGEKIEVDSTIVLKTKITAISTYDKTVSVSVGGFAGKVNDSKFENVYTKTNITIVEPLNTKPKDASTSRIYVGGLIGVTNNLTLNESVVTGTLNLSKSDSNNNVDYQFEQLFVGGLIGDSQNSKFGKVLSKDIVINVENISKEAKVSPFIGKEYNTKTSNYAYDNYEVNTDQKYTDKEVYYQNQTKYKVTLDYGYENDLEKAFYVDVNKSFNRPETPKREGYKFVGWYSKDGLYNFTNKLSDNLFLTAHWKESTYEYYVAFDLGYDTTNDIDPILLEESQVIEPTEPTREGYEFRGWFEKTSNVTPYDFSKEIKGDYVFIAMWRLKEEEVKKVSIAFEIGFADDYQVDTIIVDDGEKVLAPAVDPEKEGYLFMGWYLGGTPFDFDDEINYDILLVARWYKLEVSDKTSEEIDVNTWFASEWIIDKLK